MYFGNDRLLKTWLDKCLKSAVSELRFRVNILMCPKDC